MKESIYKKNHSPDIDAEFSIASSFGRVKLGRNYIFWKKGLHWYYQELRQVQRAFRRVEAVNARLCCSNVNFDIQKLVLILKDAAELELVIGDDGPWEAEKLYEALQERQPGICYGKQTGSDR